MRKKKSNKINLTIFLVVLLFSFMIAKRVTYKENDY